MASKCPGKSVLINVILPYLVCMTYFYFMWVSLGHIDGKQVDLNDMVAVIVKCFDCNWMVGSESD